MIRYGRQRYLHEDNILSVLNINKETFYLWQISPEHALHIVKQVDDTFYEVEGTTFLVLKHGNEDQKRMWQRYTARHKLRRELTASEKVRVASEQGFKCNMCQKLLDDTFEVDHIEEHCMGNRSNNPDRRSNLQALCCHCHRLKTKTDYNRFNPLFTRAELSTDSRKKKDQNTNNPTNQDGATIFSKYFYKS
tara:strand:- start:6901 stop:7476 length:576 start_codon:yes stop_codon:yes gene_type:complete